MNFTTRLLEVPITIHDIRVVYKSLPEFSVKTNREIFTF